ncbi:unnamed protein product [Owenia fusiformis]|uniref:non-specific serine/threonine protein kinase n=1 Tax=Owenia fusiformis TaxID=6347 RepID=A0A8S4P1J1_OWEFU|nr:unnamed protein product [Owenia fusiformis]
MSEISKNSAINRTAENLNKLRLDSQRGGDGECKHRDTFEDLEGRLENNDSEANRNASIVELNENIADDEMVNIDNVNANMVTTNDNSEAVETTRSISSDNNKDQVTADVNMGDVMADDVVDDVCQCHGKAMRPTDLNVGASGDPGANIKAFKHFSHEWPSSGFIQQNVVYGTIEAMEEYCRHLKTKIDRYHNPLQCSHSYSEGILVHKYLVPKYKSETNKMQYSEGAEFAKAEGEKHSGGHGITYPVTDTSTNHQFIMKKIRLISADDTICNEILIPLWFPHKNMAGLLGSICHDEYIYIFQQYANVGSLWDVMIRSPGGTFNEIEAMAVLLEVLEALRYWHSVHICHKDLKPENIGIVRVDDATGVYVFDFGTSCVLEPEERHRYAGTPNYMAPEVLRTESMSCKCDIWSLAMTVIALLKGERPFRNLEEISIRYRVGTTPLLAQAEIPTRTSIELKGLLQWMLTPNPEDRPDASAVYKRASSILKELQKTPTAPQIEAEDDVDHLLPVDVVDINNLQLPSPPSESPTSSQELKPDAQVNILDSSGSLIYSRYHQPSTLCSALYEAVKDQVTQKAFTLVRKDNGFILNMTSEIGENNLCLGVELPT